jgi:LemA protein
MSSASDRFQRHPNPGVANPAAPGRRLGSPLLWILLIALLLAAGVVIAGIRMHNELVELDVAVDTQWKQVENQLERQYDLLPKLAAVAQRYAAHEAGIIDKLATARAAYVGANAQAKPRLAGEVDGVLSNVLALAESYPELKADQQFRELSYEIAGSQNRIALERQRYNELVGLMNARQRQLPWSLLAGGFESATFYEAPREQLVDPDLGL